MADKIKRSHTWLMSAPSKSNLADSLTTAELERLGSDVVRTFEMDKRARNQWDLLSESALKLAQQVKEPKNFPFENCANVKHPLITVAAIQFEARAYPEIVKGNQVVKCRITGSEPKPPVPAAPPQPPQAAQGPAAAGPPPGPGVPGQPSPQPGPPPMQGPGGAGGPPMMQPGMPGPEVEQRPPGAIPKNPKRERADRIETHMNYQLTEEMPEWDDDMDRLLVVLPVVGQCYKKTYYNPGEKRNVSELVLPSECYVNSKARTMEKARRITHQLWFYTNDVYERVASGLWKDPGDLGQPPESDANDDDPCHEFLEQHRYDDLDGDGYKEPYIVWVHRQTSTVVRVLARWHDDRSIRLEPSGNGFKVAAIEPDQYFTHFPFIPNPDGSMNALGFGQLLEPINNSVNTALNQLLDSGTIYNTGGGFIGRGVRMRGGTQSFRIGEWKMVDVAGGALKENIVPLPVKEPSAVLFQLLGFLVQAGKDISSVQDILTGDVQLAANMPVGTMMALVEQGLKVYTAIYKRVYRALTIEFKKLYTLNGRYLDPKVTFEISGRPELFETGLDDYSATDLTVVPMADPTLSSDMQRMLKAQALKDVSGRVGLNELEVTRRLVRSIHVEDAEQILLTDEQVTGTAPVPGKPPPPPQMIVAQAKAHRLEQQAQEAQVRLAMDNAKFRLELMELEANIAKIKAETLRALADAADTARADEIEMYKHQMDTIAKDTSEKINFVKDMVSKFPGGQPPKELPAPAPGPAAPKVG